MIHRFELIIEDTHGIVSDHDETPFDDFCEAIFEAGCDDSTPGISCGIVTIGFSREADSLESAIRSAISDVQKAGYSVQRVDVNPPPFVEEINAQLAEGSPVSN